MQSCFTFYDITFWCSYNIKKINKQDFYEEKPPLAFKEMLSQKAHAIRQLLLIIAKKNPIRNSKNAAMPQT